MSTFAEALEQATGLVKPESRLVLHSWEIHILIVLVWNPAALHLFQERLRPEVHTLAQAIRVVVHNETQYFECFPAYELEMARSFIAGVDAAWPAMAKVGGR